MNTDRRSPVRVNKRARMTEETKEEDGHTIERPTIQCLLDEVTTCGTNSISQAQMGNLLQKIAAALNERPTSLRKDLEWDSLLGLQRALFLRLGFLANSMATPQTASSWQRSVDLLARLVECLKLCYYESLSINSEMLIACTTLLRIMDQLPKFCKQTSEVTTSITQEWICCLELLDVWLHEASSFTTMILRDRDQLEKLILVLLVSTKELGNRDATNSVLGFLSRRNLPERPLDYRSSNQTLLTIAVNSLNHVLEGKSKELHIILDEDKLFYMRCLFVTGQATHVAQERFEMLNRLVKESNIKPPKSRKLALKAIEIIRLSSRHFFCNDQRSECIAGVLQLATNQKGATPTKTKNTFLPALECLEVLLTTTTTESKVEHGRTRDEILDLCRAIALDDACQESRSSATVIILRFISYSMKNASEKERMRSSLLVLSHLISPGMEETSVQSIHHCCNWLEEESTRRIVLDMRPDLFVTLAKAATSNFCPVGLKTRILKTVFAGLKNEQHVHSLSREPRIVEMLVFFIAPPSSEDQNALQQMALEVLSFLSENPCNRRLLAKQPGLLSSLIQVARRHEGTGQRPIRMAVGERGIKRQILLLAKAL